MLVGAMVDAGGSGDAEDGVDVGVIAGKPIHHFKFKIRHLPEQQVFFGWMEEFCKENEMYFKKGYGNQFYTSASRGAVIEFIEQMKHIDTEYIKRSLVEIRDGVDVSMYTVKCRVSSEYEVTIEASSVNDAVKKFEEMGGRLKAIALVEDKDVWVSAVEKFGK